MGCACAWTRRPNAKLGLEVGVVAVGEGEIAGRQQGDEDLDDLGVELAAGDAAQLGDGRRRS